MISDHLAGTFEETGRVPFPEGTVFAPASFAQRRLWLLDRLYAQNATYNLLLAYRIEGPLDVTALRDALVAVVERHEVLRTSLVLDGGDDLVQAIAPAVRVEIAAHDLRALSPGERPEVARNRIADDAALGFDLSRMPLFRASLYRLDDAEFALSICFHHIVFDGWSEHVFLSELAALYDAAMTGVPAHLEPLPIQYADFANWQSEQVAGKYLADGLGYWQRALAGAPAHLELPFDHGRSRIRSNRGGYVLASFRSSLLQGLSRLGREQGATLFMTLLAGFYVVLHRYARQDDIVIGTALAGRNREELEPLIGYFVNTVAMRATVSDEQPFADLLRDVRASAIRAQDHQDIPFERVVEVMHPERSAGISPFAQVLFILQSATSAPPSFPGLQWSRMTIHNGTSKGDLMLSVSEEADGLRCGLEYNADLFTRQSAERLLESYRLALEAAVSDPGAPIGRVSLIPPADRLLLDEVNETATFYPELRVDELIAAEASRSPDAMAVIGGRAALTYAELDRRANQLARYLQGQGVGPGALAGVCLDRSPEMVVALLAILKTGGAYVPLDPSYPAARLEFMARDAQLHAIVSSAALGPMFGALDVPIVLVDAEAEMIRTHADSPLPPSAAPDDVAYVIYTSGSTGRPKGVEVTHRNLVNFLWAMREQPGLRADDLLLAVTTISFDISCLELFLPLTVGAGVLIATTEEARDGAALAHLLERHPVTVMQATPATWRLLLAAGWKGRSPFKIICGGEALTGELASALLATGADLWNVYGPTETTVWSTLHHVVTGEGPPPIGRPIANTQVHVLDEHLQRVPIGVSGELYIGGVGVARGYLHRPELTAERFVRDPVTPERRLYRTGDLVRMRGDGTLECLGRVDHQVKLRGFRIEPGEIEAALLEQPGVDEAVVVVHDAGDGDRRLVAYGAPDTGFTAAALREALRARLPDYMIPAAFIGLARLPRTPNGKVDRAALPAAVPTAPRTAVPPRTPVERDLARIFCDVLSIDEVSVNDDFFEVGGHSLLAIQLVSRIRDVTGAELSMREVFGGPTVETLAALVADRRQRPSSATPIQPRRRRAVPVMEGG